MCLWHSSGSKAPESEHTGSSLATWWTAKPLSGKTGRTQSARGVSPRRELYQQRRHWLHTHPSRCSQDFDSLFLWPSSSFLGLPVAIKSKKTPTALWITPQSHWSHSPDPSAESIHQGRVFLPRHLYEPSFLWTLSLQIQMLSADNSHS